MLVVGISLLASLLLGVGPALDGEPVAPDRPVTGSLSPAGGEARATVRHALEVAAPGWVTVSLESRDFDAVLRLVDEAGQLVSEDADGGLHTDARLTFEAPAAGPWFVEVSSAAGGSGTYVLSVLAGRVDLPDHGPDEAHVRWLAEGAAQAHDEGLRDIEVERLKRLLVLVEQELRHTQGPVVLESAYRALQEGTSRCGIRNWEGLAWIRLGTLAWEQGEAAKAIACQEEALALLHEGRQPKQVMLALEVLGLALLEVGASPADAVEAFRRGERIAHEGGDGGGVSRFRSRLARAYEAWGDYLRAEALHERAVALAVDTGDSRLVGARCKDAAEFHRRRGHLVRAEELYRKALPALTDAGRFAAETALVSVLLERGRPDEARRRMEGLTQWLDAGGHPIRETDHRQRMAQLAFEIGDIPEAARQLEAALEVVADDDRGALLVNLGIVRQAQGRRAAARECYEQALDLSRGRQGRERTECTARTDLGRLLIEENRFAEAMAELDAARRLARSLEDVSLEAKALANMAWALRDGDDPDAARSRAEEALGLVRELGAVGSQLFALQMLAWAALDQGDLDRVEEALAEAHELLDRREMTDLDSLEAAGARSHHGGWAPLAQDLTARRLAQAEGPAEREAWALQGFAAASRWKARALLEAMAAESRPVEAVAPDLPALEAFLGEDRALVEFVEGETRIYAYVFEGGELRFHDLGDLAELRAELTAFMADITGENGQRERGDAAAIAAGGYALHRRLLAPLWEAEAWPGQLVVVPTPDLSRLPFAALVVEAGPAAPSDFAELSFLARRCRVTYGPSVGVLTALGTSSRRSGGRALLVGDAIYGREVGAGDDVATMAGGLGRIERTRDEVLDVAALLLAGEERAETIERLRRERSGSVGAAGFDLYLGADASVDLVERLRREGSAYSLLLFATHGLVDTRDPSRSGIVLSYEPRSGGLVPVPELRRLELDADLAVISACVSARGSVLRGEGVQSVARAFLQAGCRGVVASLWSVDDRAAYELMTTFTARYLDEKLPAAEALHRAGLTVYSRETSRPARRLTTVDVSSRLGHPYYWAAFIYVGADL